MRGVLIKWLLPTLLLPAVGWPDSEIEGRVLVSEQGRKLEVIEDLAVYFRPDRPSGQPLPTDEFVMATRNKEFAPRVLPITVGSQVRFPNRDPILHNVFSSSPGNTFDVGLYGPGPGEAQMFDSVGLVRVYCNVHQGMVGHILVLDTPYYGMAERDGSFHLQHIDAERGTLFLWHPQARKPESIALELPLNGPVETSLELTQRRVPDHKNKHGRPYRRDRRGRY